MLAVGFTMGGGLDGEAVAGKLSGVLTEPPQLVSRGTNADARIVNQGKEQSTFPLAIWNSNPQLLRGSSSGQSCYSLKIGNSQVYLFARTAVLIARVAS